MRSAETRVLKSLRPGTARSFTRCARSLPLPPPSTPPTHLAQRPVSAAQRSSANTLAGQAVAALLTPIIVINAGVLGELALTNQSISRFPVDGRQENLLVSLGRDEVRVKDDVGGLI